MRFPDLEAIDERVVVVFEDRGAEIRPEEQEEEEATGTAVAD